MHLQQLKTTPGVRQVQETETTIHTGSTKVCSRKLEKMSPGLMILIFCSNVWIVRLSHFGINNMTASIQPASYQWFRLVMM